MTIELVCLVGMSGFFLVAWLPLSMAKTKAWGMDYVFSNRDEKGLPPLPAWGESAGRAYENLKSNLPAFATAVLVLSVLGRSDTGTQNAAVLYVVARLAHFLFYTAGYVMPRILAWTTGLLANLYLFVRAF
jgi:uncharacterized MAPEG superfamily protein